MKSIHAIYENGVFRPLDHVSLPDQTEVEIVPLSIRQGETICQGENAQDAKKRHQNGIYEILSQSFDTDKSDLAERHNEHQP